MLRSRRYPACVQMCVLKPRFESAHQTCPRSGKRKISAAVERILLQHRLRDMTRLDGSPSPSPAPASPTVAWPMTASLDGNAAHNISDTVEALRAARPQTVHGGKASSMLPALLSPRPAKGNEFGPTKISFSSRKWRDVGVNPPVTTMGESSADGFIYTWPPPPPPRPLTSSSIKSLLLQKPPKPEAYQHERSLSRVPFRP